MIVRRGEPEGEEVRREEGEGEEEVTLALAPKP